MQFYVSEYWAALRTASKNAPQTPQTPQYRQRHPRNELRGWNERETSEPLHTCASLSVSPCILGFHVRQFFSSVTSHKPFFTLSYISTTCAHCILDKTSRLIACRLQHSSGSPPAMIIICLVWLSWSYMFLWFVALALQTNLPPIYCGA